MPVSPPSAATAAAVTATAVAGACGGRLVGDPARPISGVRSLEEATPLDLSFVADARGERSAVRSKAGLLLARSAAKFPGRDVVEVADPPAALARVLRLFHARRAARPGVHATAVVDAGASIHATAELGPFVVVGAGTTVGPRCILEAHVVVGEGCRLAEDVWLHPHVVLYSGVGLGARAEIHSGTVLGADGFGYAPTAGGILKIPQVGRVEIGEDVEIGANSCVDRASLEATTIGAGTKVDDLVMIGHNCRLGRHNFICGQVGLAGSSETGDGVVLAGQVGVGGHLRIGHGVKVGGQSGVNGDVPDGAQVNGSPHMTYRDSMRVQVELRRLPETARVVRELAATFRPDGPGAGASGAATFRPDGPGAGAGAAGKGFETSPEKLGKPASLVSPTLPEEMDG